jgi:hypothetical protein
MMFEVTESQYQTILDENERMRLQLKRQIEEINRLRGIEVEAVKFARMMSLPNGIDLYYGAHFEAIDTDNDGIVDDLRLLHERPDTLGLSPADKRKSEALRAKLDNLTGDAADDALQFTAAEALAEGSSQAQDVLEETVANVEAQG